MKNKTTKEDCFNEASTNTNSAGLEGHTENKPERHQPRRINPGNGQVPQVAATAWRILTENNQDQQP